MFGFLRRKRGFTLVELMIVVVIMAILVAVAVPVYNAVTDNAEKRTCRTNMKMVSGFFQSYQDGFYSNDGDTRYDVNGLVIEDSNHDKIPDFSGNANAAELGEFINEKVQDPSCICCVKGGTVTLTTEAVGTVTKVVITCSLHGGLSDD